MFIADYRNLYFIASVAVIGFFSKVFFYITHAHFEEEAALVFSVGA